MLYFSFNYFLKSFCKCNQIENLIEKILIPSASEDTQCDENMLSAVAFKAMAVVALIAEVNQDVTGNPSSMFKQFYD